MSTLLSLNTPLPVRVEINPCDVPVKCLSMKTRTILSTLLNPPKVIPNNDTLFRDWRGLFSLVELKSEKLGIVACDTDPTSTILTLWQKNQNVPCNVKNLIDFLEKLDRFDIIDDTRELIAEDMKNYLEKPHIAEKHHSGLDIDSDKKILTNDDSKRLNQGLDIQSYDAFVVFAEEDIDFATELIRRMENDYNLKLCVKERDLVAGHPFEHKAIIELISERCNRLIVIISPAYLKSPVNKFVVDFAQAIGIEQGMRKIIPCIYEKCELPQELRHYCMLNYSRSSKLWNFWDRLRDSIQAPEMPRRKVGVQEESFHVEVSSSSLTNLRPALVPSNSNITRPKREHNLSVKFGSLTNITTFEVGETNKSASTNALYTSPNISNTTEENNTSVANKKKSKGWFKKILHSKDDKDKKKKSWLKTKIKIPV